MDGQEKISETAEPSVSNAFHPDRDGCDCERRGLMEDEECVHNEPCWVSRAAYERLRGLKITLTREDAQYLYDHTGTMPFLRGSWSNNVRAALSEALALDTGDPVASKEVAP